MFLFFLFFFKNFSHCSISDWLKIGHNKSHRNAAIWKFSGKFSVFSDCMDLCMTLESLPVILGYNGLSCWVFSCQWKLRLQVKTLISFVQKVPPLCSRLQYFITSGQSVENSILMFAVFFVQCIHTKKYFFFFLFYLSKARLLILHGYR